MHCHPPRAGTATQRAVAPTGGAPAAATGACAKPWGRRGRRSGRRNGQPRRARRGAAGPTAASCAKLADLLRTLLSPCTPPALPLHSPCTLLLASYHPSAPYCFPLRPPPPPPPPPLPTGQPDSPGCTKADLCRQVSCGWTGVQHCRLVTFRSSLPLPPCVFLLWRSQCRMARHTSAAPAQHVAGAHHKPPNMRCRQVALPVATCSKMFRSVGFACSVACTNGS